MFLADPRERVQAYMLHVPAQVRAFAGDLAGATVLDFGCGDMVADLGLLSLGVKQIQGLDVVADWDPREAAAAQVTKAGFSIAPDYLSRLSYTAYDGTRFPFPDNHFDFVFSWSAFEHVLDVPAALSEIRRVVKPFGQIFLQVYPWFHSFPGSHLTDFIQEPFFHLMKPQEWVHEQLLEYTAIHPESTSQVLHHMWPEYCRLNRYSARQFLAAVMDAGFCIDKLESSVSDEKMQDAPVDVPIADLITEGTKVLLRPAKPFTQEQRLTAQLQRRVTNAELALADERTKLKRMQASRSWRITEPVRFLMQIVRTLRR